MGTKGKHWKVSKEGCNNIRRAMNRPEVKAKISIANKGNIAFLGRTHTEETKRKMSISQNKGGYINWQGYRILNVRGKKGIREHDLIWCTQPENLNYIPKGFVIHHIDGNKLNNNPNNLFLISRSDHARLHKMEASHSF